jgi:hypothetical protein
MGRKNLPNTSKAQVGDGSEGPDALVATTYQVCDQGETSSVVVMGSVNVTTGVIQSLKEAVKV